MKPRMPEEFYRIKRLPPYVFAEVNALKAQARGEGRDVIDLGMGNPDGPTPPHIVAKLVEAVQNPKTHGYSSSRGIPGLRRAYAAYYARRFNVELDPEREIIVTLGSKEGFANLAQAITAPGDTILVPNPCYPIHSFGFIMAGASVVLVEAHPNPLIAKSDGFQGLFPEQLRRLVRACEAVWEVRQRLEPLYMPSALVEREYEARVAADSKRLFGVS